MQEVTQDDFDSEVLSSDELVLVDFWATWCSPCKMLLPIVEAATNSMQGVKAVKVNIEECEEIARQYQVSSVPCLSLFKNGELVESSIGLKPLPVIKAFIEKHF